MPVQAGSNTPTKGRAMDALPPKAKVSAVIEYPFPPFNPGLRIYVHAGGTIDASWVRPFK